jgi:hypothetical protein
MSTGQKLLIAGGVFIVVVIVAIAAFSLGVYVGEHGWTAGPPSMAGPGAPPKGPVGGLPPGQPGQQPPGGQPGQPPGGGPGQMGQPPGGGSGQPPFGPLDDLPPGRPDVIGRVRSVAGDSITLETPQGPRLVTVNDEIEVKQAEGEEEASLEDIKPGTHIAVFGQFNGRGKTLVVQVIVILSPPPQK